MKQPLIFEDIGGKRSRIYRLLFHLVRKNNGIVLINLLLTICTSFLIVVPNRAKEVAINNLMTKNIYMAISWSAIYCMICIIGDLVDVIRNYASQRMTKELSLCAQMDASDYIQKLPLQVTSVTNASEMMMHQMEIMSGIGNLVLAMMNILVLLLTSITAFVLAFQIDPVMTICAFLIVEPIRILITRKSSEKISDRVSEQQQTSKRVWRMLTENFQHLYYIKAQNIWKFRRVMTEKEMEQERDVTCTIAKEKSKFSFISFFLANIVVGAVFIRSVTRAYYGEITIGQLTVVLSYFTLLQGRLSYMVTSVLNFVTDKRKLEEKLDFYTNPLENGDNGKKVTEIETIELKDVCFTYENSDKKILSGLDMKLSKGEFVVICGKNGGGKTTLINILLGLYQPNSGQIMIDSVPIQDLAVDSLRSCVGYLSQVPILFSGTLEQNLQLSDNHVEKEQLWKVCCTLGMDAWIENLPDGLQTNLDNPQQTLSGGEKQRIALARVLMEKHSVYLWDEPTSALDQNAKAKLLNIINEIKRDSIVVVVTHDEWMIDKADKIYRIIENEQ